MAIVCRNGRSYVYHSIRRPNGRVTSEYLGSGPLTLALARDEARGRRAETILRKRQQERWETERQRLDDLDGAMTDLFTTGEAIGRAAMEAVGYFQHERGPWRKRRVNMGTTLAEKPKPTVKPPATVEARERILTRIGEGDEKALPAFRAMLDAHPAIVDTLIRMAGVTAGAEEAVAFGVAGGNLLRKETFQREIAALTSDLAGGSLDPIVRLLAKRAALTYFSLCAEEKALGDNKKGMWPEAFELRMKMIDRRHRQFLGSVKTLALVNRLSAASRVRVEQTTLTVDVETTS
jgi:hypothetical protein